MRLTDFLPAKRGDDTEIRQLVHASLTDNDGHIMAFGHRRAAENALAALAEDYVKLWQQRDGKGFAVNEQGRMSTTDAGLIPNFCRLYRYFFCSEEQSTHARKPIIQEPTLAPQLQDMRFLTARSEAPGFDARVFHLCGQAMSLIEEQTLHVRIIEPLYENKRQQLIVAVDKLFEGLDALCEKRHGKPVQAVPSPDDAVDSTPPSPQKADWAEHAMSRRASREQAADQQSSYGR